MYEIYSEFISFCSKRKPLQELPQGNSKKVARKMTGSTDTSTQDLPWLACRPPSLPSGPTTKKAQTSLKKWQKVRACSMFIYSRGGLCFKKSSFYVIYSWV